MSPSVSSSVRRPDTLRVVRASSPHFEHRWVYLSYTAPLEVLDGFSVTPSCVFIVASKTSFA